MISVDQVLEYMNSLESHVYINEKKEVAKQRIFINSGLEDFYV